jgi:hypothetical protein
VPELLVLPQVGELPALPTVGADELHGHPVHQRLRPGQRAQAEQPEHRGADRSLIEHQLWIVADQPEDGADGDTSQDQDADRVHPAVLDDADDHPGGGEHAAQHERRHRAEAGRAQQVVGDERSRDIEDRDHRDRAQPAGVHVAYSIGRIDL